MTGATVEPASVHARLARVIAEEARLLARLEEILRDESSVLAGRDVAAIEKIGDSRHETVEALARLEAERNSACRTLALEPGSGAYERLLTWADPTRGLHRQWNRNLEIVRRCKELNDRNGAIVTLQLRRVRELLGALRGTAPSPVYGTGPGASDRVGETTRVLGNA